MDNLKQIAETLVIKRFLRKNVSVCTIPCEFNFNEKRFMNNAANIFKIETIPNL